MNLAVGEARQTDYVRSSKDAINAILDIVEEDNSGVITVTVEGDGVKKPLKDDADKTKQRE